MADDKIIIEFDGDIKQLKAKLNASNKNVDSLKKKTESFGKTALKAGAAFGVITAGIAGLVNQARKIEDLSTQFRVLTGSAEDASKIVKDLQEFSAKTPFQLEGLAQASQQLLGFGFQTEEIIPKLQQIGDVASAVGRPIEEVGFIFGQVAAAGKLTGERLLQFQERAIPIGPAIAKTMGVAEESVRDLVSRGKVGFKEFEAAFASLSEEAGFAFEGMIKQSQTLSGVISTFQDNAGLLAAELGQELLPEIKDITIELTKWLKTTKEFVTFLAKGKLGEQIADNEDLARIKKLNKLIGAADQERRARIAAINKEYNASDAIRQQASDKELQRIEQRIFAYTNERDIFKQALQQQNDLKDEQDQKDKDRKNAAKEAAEEEFSQALQDAEARATILNEEEIARIEAQNQKKQMLKDIANAKELKAQGKHDQAIKKLEQTRLKNQIAISKASVNVERAATQSKLDIAANAITLANTISQRESKAAFLASKVLALAQIEVNRGLAQGAVFAQTALLPSPANTVQAARLTGLINTNAALSAAVVAAQTVQGFAQGGLVMGGVPGIDSVPAVLQQGEIVAPRQNFEEVIGSVRAQREANAIREEGGAGSTQEITIGFRDDAFEIIEANILERRELGTGVI